MSALTFEALQGRACAGLKGPRAAEWLAARGLEVPASPNSWSRSSAPAGNTDLLVARLGAAEFFLEDAATGRALPDLQAALAAGAPGVYPVLREDAAFSLGGEGVHEALAQVCNVHFAALALGSHPVIMTLMIGVAVLIVPEEAESERRYRIWCDPTYSPSLCEEIGTVVVECGGSIKGVSG